ncbi:MAG TPA: hypothetical protein VGG36_05155 [Rhizomicrobium sp.]
MKLKFQIVQASLEIAKMIAQRISRRRAMARVRCFGKNTPCQPVADGDAGFACGALGFEPCIGGNAGEVPVVFISHAEPDRVGQLFAANMEAYD